MKQSPTNANLEVLELSLDAGDGMAILFRPKSSEFEFVDLKRAAASQEILSFLEEAETHEVKLVGPESLISKIRLPEEAQSRIVSQLDTKMRPADFLFYPENGRVRVAFQSEVSATGASTLAAEPEGPTRVLIVDDSPTIRKLLSKILDEAHGFRVVGEAANVEEADRILNSKTVDLITLDIHMPGTDGVTYLERLKNKPHPPVVMISSVNYNDAVKALRCLELGAVDYIEKPEGMKIAEDADRIRGVLKASAKKRDGLRSPLSSGQIQFTRTLAAENTLIVLGASTGGVEALRIVLTSFPENSPPVLIVQHMPPFFSAAFASRLNDICKMKIKEAEDGDLVEAGRVYIAPGGKQMAVKQTGAELRVVITNDPPVNRHAPSVDYLFRSVVSLTKRWKIVAGLLTGMGRDGADGLLALKNANVYTIAESEETAVVYGMPREAVRLNAAKSVLPLQKIAAEIFKAMDAKMRGKS